MIRRLLSFLSIFAAMIALAGCNSRTAPVALGDLAGRTSEALADLLLGPLEERPTATAPQDKPLFAKGVYETAFLSADAKGFAQQSRRVLSEGRVKEIMKMVSEELTRRGRKRGFAVRVTDFPPALTSEETDKALIATFTPAITDVSPAASVPDSRPGDRLLMARLTVTDARTNAVLAERLYYTGTDVGGLQRGEPLRYRKIR